jgi:CheY-like chemotaxis protein
LTGVVFKAGDPDDTVLVVDDYADARACIRDILEDLGEHVVEAANGQEALHFLLFHRDVRVKLIVLDLRMPVMDGWQLLTLLESYLRLAAIPIVIASAHAKQINQAAHAAIVGCLQLPYRTTQLRTLLEAAASRAPA